MGLTCAFHFVSVVFFFSSRRRHTRCSRDWSSDVCSSDLGGRALPRPRGCVRDAGGRARGCGAARRRAVGPDVHHHALTMRGPRPGRILVSEAELRARIAELGGAIARDYAGESPIVVGVLQGAFLFMADLIRAIAIDLTTDFIGVSSYSSAAKSSGQVRLLSDLSMPIEGRQGLIVEDIVDTGDRKSTRLNSSHRYISYAVFSLKKKNK